MQYTDSRGRKRRLTREQANYLASAVWHLPLQAGWGGFDSTRTVRLLNERGLITLYERPSGDPRWEVQSVTTLGRETLERWKAVKAV